MINQQNKIPVLRAVEVLGNVCILVLVMAGMLAGCGDPPEDRSPPYRLTEVEITPQEPAFTDTVRIEIHGEPNPYHEEPVDEEAIDFYTWRLTSTPVYNTEENYTEYVNEEKVDTVEGEVWGNLDREQSPHASITRTITFEIIYQTNGEEDE